jgi:RimJ/RimL family protein N-acetyltransferase
MQLQPSHLKNDTIQLIPLQPDDFEKLYAIASDPLIWEQHPTPDRYKHVIFQSYFDTGIASKGAFLIYDISQNELIGCSRFYPNESDDSTIHIGFTFFKRSSWGTNHNRKTKELMIDYAFQFKDIVLFQVGATNFRSQKAVGKLGAKKIGEQSVAYTPVEVSQLNFVYEIRKEDWN